MTMALMATRNHLEMMKLGDLVRESTAPNFCRPRAHQPRTSPERLAGHMALFD